MGIYYKVACDDHRECIDPGSIDGLSVKASGIASTAHPLGAVTLFALLNRWCGATVRLADDLADDPGYYDYVDVTAEVLAEYNQKYGTDLKYTGYDDD